ncbi:hypothetical protein AC579_10226 [Pseudocercospora musae]|uniref:Ig-like domain-containing protein n=1 Tax=Pseudocercospora musae TaxID=113226 RepID=A0A139GW20_9PEZI|nr:hypothetical protein AC579_10226 [Pseudocercospora musae]
MHLFQLLTLCALTSTAAAADCKETADGQAECGGYLSSQPYTWQCVPNAKDPSMKYGPPNNNCKYLSGDSSSKYYCCVNGPTTRNPPF